MAAELMDTEYAGEVMLPDVQITEDNPEHNYSRMRGSMLLAVFDIDDNCIGWLDPRVLGYETANDWHEASAAKGPKFQRGLL